MSQGWCCGICGVPQDGAWGERNSGWGSDPPCAPCPWREQEEQGSVLSLAGLSCSSPTPEETGHKGGTDVLGAALLRVKEKSWELISVFIREGEPDVSPPE